MAKRLFVGSLPYTTTEEQIRELFSQAGTVDSVNVIPNREAPEGQGKGFAFVEMATDDDARKAIEKLDGYKVDGRSIIVNIAHPKEDRNGRGGGRYDSRSSHPSSGYSRNRY